MNSKSELKRLCAQDPVGMTKKILELEQRVKVLVAGLRKLADMQIVEQFEIIEPMLDESKTAAQIERWHIEWMMNLPVAAWDALGEIVASGPYDYPFEVCVKNGCTPLYQIPPFPKESKE